MSRIIPALVLVAVASVFTLAPVVTAVFVLFLIGFLPLVFADFLFHRGIHQWMLRRLDQWLEKRLEAKPGYEKNSSGIR